MCSEDDKISIKFFCDANDLMAGGAFGEDSIGFHVEGIRQFFEHGLTPLPGFFRVFIYLTVFSQFMVWNTKRSWFKYVQSFEFCIVGLGQLHGMETGLFRSS